MKRLTLAGCVLGLIALVAGTADAQTDPQPAIPRGGGMFPNVPSGSQNNQPNRSGMFPNVPVVTLNKPTPAQPAPPGDHPPHGDGRPIIVVTPGWDRPGTAAGDQRLQAVQRALSGAAGVPVTWTDGNTFGQVTPVGERLISGMNCRDLSQSVTALGQTQQGNATYCLTPAGEWMLAGP